MNNTIKKRLSLVMIMVMMLSVMLTGCGQKADEKKDAALKENISETKDSQPEKIDTPEKLIEKMKEARSESKGIVVDSTASFKVSMQINGIGNVDTAVNSETRTFMCMDPLSIHIKGTNTISGFGEEESVESETYIVNEDGKYVSYENMPDIYDTDTDRWERIELDQTADEIIKQNAEIVLEPSNTTLDSSVTSYDGHDVILAITRVSGKDAADLMGGLLDDIGADSGIDISKLTCDIKTYVDSTTFLPVAQEISMSGLEEMLAASYGEMGVSISDCDCAVTAKYSPDDDMAQITIPQEVKDAANE